MEDLNFTISNVKFQVLKPMIIKIIVFRNATCDVL